VTDTFHDDPLARFLEQDVVLDTQGPLLYLGTLREITPAALVLVNADVHDSNDSRASKDLYIVESRVLGVRVNRAAVVVMRSQVASASLLRDAVD
jgi:hypothetical protein